MHARVSFYELGSASRDDAVRAFEGARGAVEEMEGNRGGMLLVDTDGGKAITITFWESEDALRASEQRADDARREAPAEPECRSARSSVTRSGSSSVGSEGAGSAADAPEAASVTVRPAA